jgi:AcrR family transcriptional regulator
VRFGRPPRERAGEVEERILEAARKIFLDRGFDGASIEEIAESARSGKPTIYARFPNKRALFAAAFTRYIIDKSTQLENYAPTGTTIEERLTSVGMTLVERALTGDGVGLSRLAIAEARRFPELSSHIITIARERSSKTLAKLLREVTEAGELEAPPPTGSERYETAARYFADLVVLPFFMRSLAGESVDKLLSEAAPSVAHRVNFFLAGWRHGGLR